MVELSGLEIGLADKLPSPSPSPWVSSPSPLSASARPVKTDLCPSPDSSTTSLIIINCSIWYHFRNKATYWSTIACFIPYAFDDWRICLHSQIHECDRHTPHDGLGRAIHSVALTVLRFFVNRAKKCQS